MGICYSSRLEARRYLYEPPSQIYISPIEEGYYSKAIYAHSRIYGPICKGACTPRLPDRCLHSVLFQTHD